MRKQSLIYLTFALVLAQAILPAQQLQKVMTNEDVLALVRAHKPETVILSQIESRPSSFDMSAHEIIRLTKAGVTENVLNAMMAAQNKGGSTASSAKPGTGQ